MKTVSIVIPAWNEKPLIADAVVCARQIAEEVIVADAGSPDGTAAAASAAGAKVVQADRGRGTQLHAGALAATGDVLLFLHADARLPPGARQAMLARLHDPYIIGGNFYLRFLPESWFTRFLAPMNDVRRILTRRYYGDSGIFVQREVYRGLGGYRPYPLMEDYDFSARMEAAGRCAYVRNPCVIASARRFVGREVRTFLLWMALQTLYWLKMPPSLLYRWYPNLRSEEPERFLAAYREAKEFGFEMLPNATVLSGKATALPL